MNKAIRIVVQRFLFFFNLQSFFVPDHIISPFSIKMPIDQLIPLCKKFNVLSLIDGTHAPGQIPLNLKDLGADFYTGKSYFLLLAICDIFL